MQVYGPNVIAKREAAPTKTAGGLHLPTGIDETYNSRGIIVDIGTGLEEDEGTLKVGDQIIFSACMEFTGGDGVKYVIVEERHILCIDNR